eukprot:TRINITY_DN2281_c0_g1_i1.p1 TRINITY_DN2281_c0_g1~~TRINITY_DN2281_c0_g1_i1.p1  ORF type:complete len:145 (-),score=16.64 TRINITY_DN2281_c0_g1_i1:65-499(-)
MCCDVYFFCWPDSKQTKTWYINLRSPPPSPSLITLSHPLNLPIPIFFYPQSSVDEIFDKLNAIENQTGVLAISHSSGEVVKASGDFENDEKIASVLYGIMQDTQSILNRLDNDETFQRVTFEFQATQFTATVTNGNIYLVKMSI